MSFSENEPTPCGQFALACERMNEFSRILRESCQFEMVRTGADIRNYENGWRLEKWVEAELDKSEGYWAVWWLELGPHKQGWLIESHVAVSPNLFFAGLEDRTATSTQELQVQLPYVVDELKNALSQNKQFADAVTKTMEKK